MVVPGRGGSIQVELGGSTARSFTLELVGRAGERRVVCRDESVEPSSTVRTTLLVTLTADEVPADPSDWKVVVTGLTALQDALDDAGVDPATYDRDHPPEGLSQQDEDRIDAAAQQLTTKESVAAFEAVDQQARDVCKTPLRL